MLFDKTAHCLLHVRGCFSYHSLCKMADAPGSATQECDDLIARGISGTGAGFDAPSAGKVGGRFTGRADDVPPHRLRELALQAAEARLKRQAVMPVGPRTTGGLGSQACVPNLQHLLKPVDLSATAMPPMQCHPFISCCVHCMQAATCPCATCRRGKQLQQRQSAGEQPLCPLQLLMQPMEGHDSGWGRLQC